MKRGRVSSDSSYLYQLSPFQSASNFFTRITSDIVRIVARHLESVADVVALALACKYTYRAVSPLFTLKRTRDEKGRDLWEGFCVSVIGNVTPIMITRVRGGSAGHLFGGTEFVPIPFETIKEDGAWSFTHLNKFKEILDAPIDQKDGKCYVYGSKYETYVYHNGGKKWAYIVLSLCSRDVKHLLFEVRLLLRVSNAFAYKRSKLSKPSLGTRSRFPIWSE